MSFLILGIDPGNTHSAAVIIEDGRILQKFREPNNQFLMRLLGLKRMFPGCRVVCEMIASYGMPVGREVFDTCVMIGRIQALFPCMDRVTRGAVKLEICKSPKAGDPNIRRALIDIYGPPGTKKNPGGTWEVSGDMWAALAVATAAAAGCKLYVEAAA